MDEAEAQLNQTLERAKKLDELSRRVLTMSRNTLLVNLRFLDMALSKLEYVPTTEDNFDTDGKFLFYNPEYILKRYKAEKEALVHDYLHAILHCVFRHMFVHTLVDHDCWNLACDIAVEYTIYGLNLRSARVNRETLMKPYFEEFEKSGIMITAEKLYRYFLDARLSRQKMAELRGVFYSDTHDDWYMSTEEKAKKFNMGIKTLPGHGDEVGEEAEESEDEYDSDGSEEDGDETGAGESEGEGEEADRSRAGRKQGKSRSGGQKSGKKRARSSGLSGSSTEIENSSAEDHWTKSAAAELEQEWKHVSESMQMDMETFSNGRGGVSQGLIQNLKEVNREKYDYTAFLKKFATMGEIMKVNDDEFDYIYYTYGLKMYKKVPLIEPLEYKDTKRIKEFILAIDTSGSVVGDLVQRFVQKTYNIMKSTESFFSKINLHIIQCDDQIQEDKKITSSAEFDDYFAHMQLKGFGGNNEIRLFSYVDDLIAKKEFTNLKGMIYLTDGYGIFPKKKPDYEVAFVFIENARWPIPDDIPPWAIKLVLEKEDI